MSARPQLWALIGAKAPRSLPRCVVLEVPDIEFEPLDDEQELNEQEAEEAMAEGIADHLEQDLNEPTMESTYELPNPKMEDPI
jgi:hypothetical protein